MEWILAWIAAGGVVAYLAARKGLSAPLWFAFGFLIPIVALPCVLLVAPSSERYQRCPSCWKWSHRRKRICRRCGEDLIPQERARA